jgi:hypothetical protein
VVTLRDNRNWEVQDRLLKLKEDFLLEGQTGPETSRMLNIEACGGDET